MPTALPFPRYLDHLRADSARFADVLAGVDPTTRVPTCPDWDAADLAHHLTVVQSFWAAVVRGPLLTDEQIEAVQEPPRADAFEGQLDLLRAATIRLTGALADTPPETPAWTWSSEQTVGFTYRRQALEALVHRLDAELVADQRTRLDPHLAADGVDEALRVMLGGCPPWGTITPTGGGWVRLDAADVEASWLVGPARFTGTDPQSGQEHDQPDIVVRDGSDSDAQTDVRGTIAGTAEDLLCRLWKRPTAAVVREDGDPAVMTAVGQVLGQPIT